MSKSVTIRLVDETDEVVNSYLRGPDVHLALWEISQEIFRPARKHGYSDPRLANLSEGEIEIIDILEERFYEILREHGVDISI